MHLTILVLYFVKLQSQPRFVFLHFVHSSLRLDVPDQEDREEEGGGGAGQAGPRPRRLARRLHHGGGVADVHARARLLLLLGAHLGLGQTGGLQEFLLKLDIGKFFYCLI